MRLTLVLLASGIGALARYELAGAVQRRAGGTRPWGTAAVNVSGALLLGLLVGLHASARLSDAVFAVAGAGFCGGFTTFSTWMVESVRLGEEGGASGLVAVAVNLGAMFAAGLAVVAVIMVVV
jgi:fluoride exporter